MMCWDGWSFLHLSKQLEPTQCRQPRMSEADGTWGAWRKCWRPRPMRITWAPSYSETLGNLTLSCKLNYIGSNWHGRMARLLFLQSPLFYCFPISSTMYGIYTYIYTVYWYLTHTHTYIYIHIHLLRTQREIYIYMYIHIHLHVLAPYLLRHTNKASDCWFAIWIVTPQEGDLELQQQATTFAEKATLSDAAETQSTQQG